VTAIGIDIGGTKLLAVVIGPDGTFTTEPQVPAPRTPRDLIDSVLEVSQAAAGAEGVTSIGIGVPGLVDDHGVLVFAPNLSGANGAHIGDALSREVPGAAIWVGNDATAAGWAEHQVGAGQGSRHMLMVTLGTGIGGGVVSGGVLNEGAHRFAGEFGHMVVDPSGPQCPCGKKGCWERFASGAGLGLLARELAVAGGAAGLVERAGGDPEDVRGEHVTEAAAAGDPSALEIMRRFGWWAGLGLANLANIFDPDVIVIGGGLIGAGEVLMAPIRRSFLDLVEAADRRPVADLRAATLGPRAGAVGAGLLAAGLAAGAPLQRGW
jgi:glucokinase